MKNLQSIYILIVLSVFIPNRLFGQSWLTVGNNIVANEYLGGDGTSTIPLALKTVTNFPINFYTNFGTVTSPRVTITGGNASTGGFVGIGTASPADKLHVHIPDSVNIKVRISSAKSPNGLQVGVEANGHGSVNMADNFPLNLSTNGVHRIHINDVSGTNRGFVGMGNNFNTPTCRLQISENGGNDTWLQLTSEMGKVEVDPCLVLPLGKKQIIVTKKIMQGSRGLQ